VCLFSTKLHYFPEFPNKNIFLQKFVGIVYCCTFAYQNDKTMTDTPAKLEDCDFRKTEQYISKPQPNDDPDCYEDIDTED